MKPKNWIIAYFSPTGGTKKVADAVSFSLKAETEEIDLCKDITKIVPGKDTALIALVPVYCGRVPALALERLSAIKGSGQPAVAVVVYGNREYDDALIELCDALGNCGFSLGAAAAFIAEHSVVRSVAAGRPDAGDIEDAHKFGAALSEKNFGERDSELVIPGKRPYLEMKDLSIHPHADGQCIKCGRCALSCPANAISPDALNESIHGKCINCMRCVDICPAKARSLPADYLAGSKKMLSEKASGYKKPEIYL